MRAEAAAGLPEPLGATLTASGARFAFCAPDATAIFVCVFDAQDREVARIRLPGRGVPAGANKANHDTASKPARPCALLTWRETRRLTPSFFMPMT